VPIETQDSYQRRTLAHKPYSTADRVFFGLARAASGMAIAIVLGVLIFLGASSAPALQSQGIGFVTGTTWNNQLDPIVMQMGPMLWGSFLIAFIGILISLPLSLAVAYSIEFMLPRPLAKVATLLVDLLASIPSIVIGLWGVVVFSPIGSHWGALLNQYLGFIPIFQNSSGNYLGSPFIAGWIVAVMTVPIISSVTREVFSQLDRDVINAGLALGGTKASTFLKIILPTSAGGVVGGTLLGFGRALGETVAIYFVLNLIFGEFNWFQILESYGGSVASMIVAKFGEAGQLEVQGLLAAGLVLFVLTLAVNWIAAVIVDKAQPWRRDS
jgi:phosphate transport system permease protein